MIGELQRHLLPFPGVGWECGAKSDVNFPGLFSTASIASHKPCILVSDLICNILRSKAMDAFFRVNTLKINQEDWPIYKFRLRIPDLRHILVDNWTSRADARIFFQGLTECDLRLTITLSSEQITCTAKGNRMRKGQFHDSLFVRTACRDYYRRLAVHLSKKSLQFGAYSLKAWSQKFGSTGRTNEQGKDR